MPNRSFDFFCLLLALVLFLGSCKKETLPPSDSSSSYYPFTKGLYRVYEVDSVVHAESDNNNDDSVFYYHYQVMEVLDSSWVEASGRKVQEVERYYRVDSAGSWRITGVWTQQLNNLGGYRTEDNIPFQKMAFPVSSTVVWNGNAANTLEDEYYRYDAIHQQENINGLEFDSVTTVIQRDDDNFVERFYGEEKYVVGIGMAYRRRDELGKRNGQVVEGTEFSMLLIDYGIFR